MADERYEIAYQEALRSISDQQTALQNRASTVASAGAVITGLIGLRNDAGTGSGALGFVAIASLLIIVILSGTIMWPRREWRFHFRASDLQWNYLEGPRRLSADLMKRDLALHLESYFHANAERIDRFGVLLSVAIVLLFVNVIAVALEVWRS